jgi:hypothetical protein
VLSRPASFQSSFRFGRWLSKPAKANSELAQRYKLQIITDYEAVEKHFSFSSLDNAQLKKAGDLLISELTLYSPEAIAASKFERLVLCSDLRGGEDTVSGLSDIGILAVDTIFVNIDRAAKVWEQARRTVHHELFHCMDYHDDGYLEFEWRKLNSPDFTYWHMNNLSACETNQEGFLQDYCKRSEWEDKAVVFSYMMVNHAELLDRCRCDDVLEQKVQHMKGLLVKISPEFDDEFWKRIHERSLHTYTAVDSLRQVHHRDDDAEHEIDSAEKLLNRRRREEWWRSWCSLLLRSCFARARFGRTARSRLG